MLHYNGFEWSMHISDGGGLIKDPAATIVTNQPMGRRMLHCVFLNFTFACKISSKLSGCFWPESEH